MALPVRVLLDTHAFLWLIQGDARVSTAAAAIFLEPENELFFSAARYWEICIKQALGKLGLAHGWQAVLDAERAANSIGWLEINKAHCQGILHLPPHHGDPFDRLLISQAIAEHMLLLSADGNMQRYTVETVW